LSSQQKARPSPVTAQLLLKLISRAATGGSCGQLGPGNGEGSLVPVQVAGASDVKQISASGGGVCAVRRSGEVVCWGTMGGDDGKLEVVKGLSGIVEVQTSGQHACARNDAGKLWCWGDGERGATGSGPPVAGPKQGPTEITKVEGVTSIGADTDGTCVLTHGGNAARCWGLAIGGRLGNGAATVQPTPVKVEGVSDARSVALYGITSCALHRDGSASCWGGKRNGVVGLKRRFPPKKLDGAKQLKALALSGGLQFGIDGDGKVTRWMAGGPDPKRVAIAGLEGVAALHGEAGRMSAALSNGKLAHVWLGWFDEKAVVQPLIGLSDATTITTASCRAEPGARCTRMCTVRKSGRIGCLRYQRKGDAKASAVPTAAKLDRDIDVDDVKAMALRKQRGCAVRGDGSLVCWKYSDDDKAPEPKVIAGVDGAIDVALGYYDGQDVCALMKSGKVLCWTSNAANSSGLLGNGTLEHHTEPKPVVGIDDAIALAMTDKHACVAHRDGSVSCWGENDHDQVGTKLPGIAFEPVKVGF
jgi:hypothetical protein